MAEVLVAVAESDLGGEGAPEAGEVSGGRVARRESAEIGSVEG